MYQKMKDKGIDMSWYEKNKAKTKNDNIIPISDEECDATAIYYLEDSGKLFTIDSEGDKHKQVRQVREIPESRYLCMHCKKDFKTYALAVEHAEGSL